MEKPQGAATGRGMRARQGKQASTSLKTLQLSSVSLKKKNWYDTILKKDLKIETTGTR